LLQIVQSADVIFIAVKPQYVSVVLREVRPHLQDRHTIVSIAAGITLQSLKVRMGWEWHHMGGLEADVSRACFHNLFHKNGRHAGCRNDKRSCRPCAAERRRLLPPALPPVQEAAGDNVRLVRVMPNTPCLVGETAAAM
jgi:hypothetical protein